MITTITQLTFACPCLPNAPSRAPSRAPSSASSRAPSCAPSSASGRASSRAFAGSILVALLNGTIGCASTHDAADSHHSAVAVDEGPLPATATDRAAQMVLADDAVGAAVGNGLGPDPGAAAGSETEGQRRADAALKSPPTAGLRIGAAKALDPAFAGVPATDLAPLGSAVERWRVVAGDGLGREFERRRQPSGEPGASASDRWGDDQTYELSSSPDGGIVMPTTIAHHDRAVTFFEPPLSLAPPLLRFGAPLRSEARMKVVDEGDRSKLQHSGRAQRTLTLVDMVAIETPMGSFDALRVRIEFRATLQLATATEVATQYVVPGLGVVAEERIERVNAIGFINRSTKRTIVRVE